MLVMIGAAVGVVVLTAANLVDVVLVDAEEVVVDKVQI
jgi:hypothetical protein